MIKENILLRRNLSYIIFGALQAHSLTVDLHYVVEKAWTINMMPIICFVP